MVLINRLSVDLDSARERERELIERLIAAGQRASRAEGELAALRSAPPRPGFWPDCSEDDMARMPCRSV